VKYLKLYGLQRSGTNYIKFLLEQNFDVFVLQNWLGWKHGRVEYLKDNETLWRDLSVCTLSTEQKASIKFSNTPRVAIKKNVHAWMVSFYKYKRFNWGRDYKHIIDAYFTANRHYEKHCWMVDYDDLLTQPCVEMEAMMHKFDLSQRLDKKAWVTEYEKTMPRGGDDHSDSWAVKYENHKFSRSYYLEKKYLRQIPNLGDINKYIKKHYEK